MNSTPGLILVFAKVWISEIPRKLLGLSIRYYILPRFCKVVNGGTSRMSVAVSIRAGDHSSAALRQPLFSSLVSSSLESEIRATNLSLGVILEVCNPHKIRSQSSWCQCLLIRFLLKNSNFVLRSSPLLMSWHRWYFISCSTCSLTLLETERAIAFIPSQTWPLTLV